MTLKRIKNKKIENDHKYKIYHIESLAQNKIQDHTEIALNTGMEDEEKEEFHLKSALTNEDSNIPVPRIEHVATHSSKKGKYTHKRSREYIKYYNDVENKYILCNEDLEFMEEHNISEAQFYNRIDAVREENEKLNVHDSNSKKNDMVWNYIQNRVLLLHDHGEFNCYACFRKRIIKSARKSRKVEINVTEKLKRMWIEICDVEKMVNTTKDLFRLEDDAFETNNKILDQSIPLLGNKKIRRKLKHRLVGIKRKPIEVPFYKKVTYNELSTNRQKMNEFKLLVTQAKLTQEEINLDVRILNS